jgi:phage terminase large subunit GpA-like protein
MSWAADQITLPYIKGSPSAGACVRVAGITGRIRGLKHTRPDGKTLRPSLVLIDDPQTDESAASPSQCQTREKILSGAILGLAGPGAKIAGLCTITVIRPDDLADRLLDRVRHPSWQGERTKLVYEWPTADDLWSEYGELRRSGQRNGTGTAEADAFYVERREAMDAGSRVAWPERLNPDETSAIQHAWNLRIDRGESAFHAEYQNQPIAEDVASDKLDKRALAGRVTTLAKGVVPANHHQLTAFIDVQDRVLFWLVCSWSESFGGNIVQYGCYPDQGVSYFEAGSAKRTLAKAGGVEGFEAALHAGLDTLTQMLIGKEWKREDGAAMRIGQLMVDANWGKSTATVRTFAKRSPWASTILPSHGRGIGASSPALTDKGKARGDKIGLNWRIGNINGQRSVTYDTNYWKTFVAARLRLATGDPEALVIHAGEHDLLFDHLTNEYPVRTESARGRVVDEWKLSGTRWENHWWDCLVGAAVAASIAGVQPTATESGGRQRRKVTIPAAGGRQRIEIKRLR